MSKQADYPIRVLLLFATRRFADFVDSNQLSHPEIDSFLRHWWDFHNPDFEFDDWHNGYPDLEEMGLGYDYPVGFAEYLDEQHVCRNKFRQIVESMIEIFYSNYQSKPNWKQTRSLFDNLIQLTSGVQTHDLSVAGFQLCSTSDYSWGDPIEFQRVRQWKDAR